MLRKQSGKQLKMEFVCLEDLVPKDHLLRKIDKYVEFDFIYEKVSSLYCPDNGRPALDPVVMFKMLFIGYLFNIRSEKQLIREIKVNIAYRWFLGMGLEDPVPDASTFSQNRRRRFKSSQIYREIFDEIVNQAVGKKMVSGKILYTDSTHLKANANKNKHTRKEVSKSTKAYIDDLEKEINEDRKAHGKKPLKPKEPKNETRQIKSSTTDPDSGYMVRDGKPKGFFYLDHRTVDSQFNIITDTFVTAGNVHDSVPYLARLDHQRQTFGFNVESVGLDAGYLTAPVCHGLDERGIYGVMPYRRTPYSKGLFSKRYFLYDASYDAYICPGNHHLKYRTTTREGYREYASNPSICRRCELREQCTRSQECRKVITRHVWEDSRERVKDNRLTDKGKKIYKRRKETVERSFADAKELHGHRYARMRGLTRVTEQCLLCAAAMNIKKMALYLARKDRKQHKGNQTGYFALLLRLTRLINRSKLAFLSRLCRSSFIREYSVAT